MKARIIFEYKDEKIQEILKENDITTADELKGLLKGAMSRCKEHNDNDTYTWSVEVDYGNRCPMLTGQFVMNVNLIDELKEKNKKLEKEIEDLENRLFKETQLNNTLLIENQKMKEQIDELHNQPSVSEFEAKIKDLEKDVACKGCIIKSYEKMIGSRNEEIKELRKQNNELMDKIELLEDTPVECSTCCIHNKCQVFEKENKELKEKYDLLNDAHQTVKKNCVDFLKEIEKLKEEKEDLNTKLVEYTWKVIDLKKENKALQEKYDQVLEFNGNLHEGNGELYKQNENLMKDNKDLKEKVKTLEKSKDNLKKWLNTYYGKSGGCIYLQEKVKGLEEATTELMDENSKLKSTIEDLEKMCHLNYKIGRRHAYEKIIDKLEDNYCIPNPMINDSTKKKYTRDEVDGTVNNVLIDYRIGLRTYFQSELDAIK